MFLESLLIFLDNSTVWFFISCVISILAVVIAYQYTKNIDVKNSSATDRYFSDRATEYEEELDKIDKLCSKTSDKKHENVNKEVGAGGDNSDQQVNAFTPELLTAAGEIPDDMWKAKEKLFMHNLESKMSEDQKIIEKKIQQEQLSEIFKLVEEQSDKFGISSLADMEEQMKLYRS